MNHVFHFLVVEESIAARIVIRGQLMQLDQRVDMTSTVEDALDKITGTSYDIMLIDIHSYNKVVDPDIPSLIKKLKPNSALPIIIITSQNEYELNQTNLSAEGPIYFKKPFNQNSAMNIINYLKFAILT
jgi:CheY-like chemotaxis protein